VFVAVRDDVYFTGGRKGKWQPLSLQPNPTNIAKVYRHYATLQADINYRKRMTKISNVPGGDNKAAVEYQGCHPGVNREPSVRLHTSRHSTACGRQNAALTTT